jgi:hypothetical protein
MEGRCLVARREMEGAVRANLIDDVGVVDGWEISVSAGGGGSVGRWRRIGDRF